MSPALLRMIVPFCGSVKNRKTSDRVFIQDLQNGTSGSANRFGRYIGTDDVPVLSCAESGVEVPLSFLLGLVIQCVYESQNRLLYFHLAIVSLSLLSAY